MKIVRPDGPGITQHLMIPCVKSFLWVQIFLGLLTSISQIGVLSISYYYDAEGVLCTVNIFGSGILVGGLQLLGAGFSLLANNEPSLYWFDMTMAFPFHIVATIGSNFLAVYLCLITIPELRALLGSYGDDEVLSEYLYYVTCLTIQTICATFLSIPIGTFFSLAIGGALCLSPATMKINCMPATL